jgi:hypothetical protein
MVIMQTTIIVFKTGHIPPYLHSYIRRRRRSELKEEEVYSSVRQPTKNYYFFVSLYDIDP